jgi:tripartite-type tricarboxylate transporter receptor subunit TctC
LPFHPEKDFAPISLVVSGPSVLVVTPSLPAHNIKEHIAFAKAKHFTKSPSTGDLR